jgi:hypothetical protein
MSYTSTAWVDHTTTIDASKMNQIELMHYITNNLWTTAGGTTVYTLTITGATLANLVGLPLKVKFNANSTGASTLNVNGLGAKGLKRAAGTDFTAFLTTGIYTLVYDGTSFFLQGESPVLTGDAIAGDVAAGKYFYKDDAYTRLEGTYVPDSLSGDALPANVLSGKTFYNTDAGTEETGTMPNNAGDVAALSAHMGVGTTIHVVPAEGYTDGSDDASTIDLTTVDADLAAANIANGVTILGQAGSASVVTNSTSGSVSVPLSTPTDVNLAYTPTLVMITANDGTDEYVTVAGSWADESTTVQGSISVTIGANKITLNQNCSVSALTISWYALRAS